MSPGCARSFGRIALLSPLAVLLVMLVAAGAARADSLRVGTCQRDITPISPPLQAAYQAAFGVAGAVNHTDPIFLAGFGDNRRATGYHDRLWARGVVLESKGTRIAIVALDLIGYFKNEVDTARADDLARVGDRLRAWWRARTSTRVPTRSASGARTSSTTGIDFGYLDFVNAAIADCIDSAAALLQNARVYYATANSAGLSLGTDPEDDGFGVSDGKVLAGDAALAPATDGRIVDPNLAMMQLTKRDAPFDVIATLVNFGSHPESLGSNNPLGHVRLPALRARSGSRPSTAGSRSGSRAISGCSRGRSTSTCSTRITNAAGARGARSASRRCTERSSPIARSRRSTPCASTPPACRARRTATPRRRSPSRASTRWRCALDNPFFRFFFAIGVIDVRRAALHGRRARPLDRNASASRGLPAGRGRRGPAHRGQRGADRRGRVRGRAGRARSADRLRLPQHARGRDRRASTPSSRASPTTRSATRCRSRNGTTAATRVRRSSSSACRSSVRCSRTSTAIRCSRTTSGRRSTRRSRRRCRGDRRAVNGAGRAARGPAAPCALPRARARRLRRDDAAPALVRSRTWSRESASSTRPPRSRSRIRSSARPWSWRKCWRCSRDRARSGCASCSTGTAFRSTTRATRSSSSSSASSAAASSRRAASPRASASSRSRRPASASRSTPRRATRSRRRCGPTPRSSELPRTSRLDALRRITVELLASPRFRARRLRAARPRARGRPAARHARRSSRAGAAARERRDTDRRTDRPAGRARAPRPRGRPSALGGALAHDERRRPPRRRARRGRPPERRGRSGAHCRCSRARTRCSPRPPPSRSGRPERRAPSRRWPELLGSKEPRVRAAAIRGLGRIGTPRAREALAKAAASHPDAATRRRASAEVRLLERQPS